ncbi:MAG TPA: thiaminase II [Legionella sp.]|nr:thiaminase II [Legionella sp.]
MFAILSNAVGTLLDDIHRHPFNQELAQGTLAHATFMHYLQQDALYLADFSRALALTAARLPNSIQSRQCLRLALDSIEAEQDLQQNYLAQQTSGAPSAQEQSPACFMYTQYILKMGALASVEEALACLLPCFWIYREVGYAIASVSTIHNPYSDWIALYSSEQFNQSVMAMIDMTNDLGAHASSETLDKMRAAFVRSTQLEWLFWDGAYRQTPWIR